MSHLLTEKVPDASAGPGEGGFFGGWSFRMGQGAGLAVAQQPVPQMRPV